MFVKYILTLLFDLYDLRGKERYVSQGNILKPDRPTPKINMYIYIVC